ncbi:MAG TPA: hypothetical protein VIY51_20115 [Xanthobacteraceae bacterium]
MSRMLVSASAALVLGLAIAAGGPSAAQAYTSLAGLDCGDGYDRCMQVCNMSIWTGAPGPMPPGRCNDYCAQGTNICEAGRIPRPGHRSHYRTMSGRK